MLYEIVDTTRYFMCMQPLFADGATTTHPMRRYENMMNPSAFRMDGGDSMPLTLPMLNHISRGQLNWNSMTMNHGGGGGTRSSSRSSSQN